VRYVPKEIKGNVNISKKSPLKEIFSLLLSALGIILVIYIALGFAVDFLAPKVPEKVEEKLSLLYKPVYSNKKEKFDSEKNIQELLDSLVEKLKDNNKRYEVHVVKSKYINALALPGGKIVIFSELLKEVESENELAFVLAHELGHFRHKDHLKALGRNMVLFVISSIFLGQDATVTNFFGTSLTKVEMKFSQTQERNADLFAVELLDKKYKHAGGATEFLKHVKEKQKIPNFFYLFATHPHPENRIKKIEEKIQEEGYLIKEKTLLDTSIKEEFSKEESNKPSNLK